jgi:calcineurin-like phosphoesterase family protein
MSDIWLSSDLHLMHNKPFLYEPRGFTSTEEMCEAIVERWNSVVRDEDFIYNLGDIALSDIDAAIPYLQRLNGHQIWILGNHDTLRKIEKILPACPRIQLLGTEMTSYATVIKSGKWSFYLSHYPTLTGNREEWRKVANLCGHSHTQDKWTDWDKMCYHVEMDAHNCYPVNLDQIKEDIRNKRIKQKNDNDFNTNEW